jgi:hypothetical protein
VKEREIFGLVASTADLRIRRLSEIIDSVALTDDLVPFAVTSEFGVLRTSNKVSDMANFECDRVGNTTWATKINAKCLSVSSIFAGKSGTGNQEQPLLALTALSDALISQTQTKNNMTAFRRVPAIDINAMFTATIWKSRDIAFANRQSCLLVGAKPQIFGGQRNAKVIRLSVNVRRRMEVPVESI